ncbi:MAG: hypothetical protein HY319_17420 [Armatimonadetes bacterium]|nr:hypothetical protein [Armatimonadota bacterium]
MKPKKGPATEPQKEKDGKEDPTIKEYHGGLTRKALLLALLPIGIALLLIQRALQANTQFAFNDPDRWLFILLPMLLGVGILVVMVLTAARNAGKRVILARSGLTYQDSHDKFVTPWGTLAYSPPKRGGATMVRSLLLSDGVKFGQLYDVFTPRFDEIVQEVEARKGYASTSTRFKMG